MAALPAAGCAGDGDPNWPAVIAYIPCTATISDASALSTITIDNTPTVSAVPAGAPGGASCSLGNGGAINTANGFEVALPSAIGTGDFTVELSLYQTASFDPTDQQSEILISSSAYPPAAGGFPTFFSHQGTDNVQFISGAGGQSYTDVGSALGVWENYAASRVAGTTYVFRDGVLLTSFADTTDYSDTLFYVAHQANGSYNAVMGSIGQIRITKAGRYTADYTPCGNGFSTQ